MSSSPITFCKNVLIVCLVLVLAACGHEQVRRVPSDDSSRVPPARDARTMRVKSSGEEAAVVAVRQVGVPYRYGGSTTRGFDCSGLVQYAWSAVGKKIPRTTAEQWRQLSPVQNRDLRAGDLLFFRIDGKISHVGLYLGDRRFVHAPSTGRDVTVASLDTEFYQRTFVRAARP
ncbi:MAG: C40 family peptidase [Woeseiaceae bacterium]